MRCSTEYLRTLGTARGWQVHPPMFADSSPGGESCCTTVIGSRCSSGTVSPRTESRSQIPATACTSMVADGLDNTQLPFLFTNMRGFVTGVGNFGPETATSDMTVAGPFC